MINSSDWLGRKDFEYQLIEKAIKDASFKQELLTNPKEVIAREFGTQLPPGIEIRVLEETAKISYIVLPYQEQ